jgi:hypothetical protein
MLQVWVLAVLACLAHGDLLPFRVSKEYKVLLVVEPFGGAQRRAEGVAQLLRFLEDLEDNQLGKGVFSFRKGSGVALGVPQEYTRLMDPGDTFAANYSLLVRFRREGQVTDLTAKHYGSTPEEALQIDLVTPR